MKYVIFGVEGGMGKNVAATAVVRAINKQYPDRKIIVLTAYPDVWLCNPRIEKVLQFGMTPYFYKDYIDGKDTLIFIQEPYKQTDAIYRNKHLSQIWCEMYGINWDGETPEMYFTSLEFDFVAQLINKQNPIFLIQTAGGGANQTHKYSWARDLSPVLSQEVVNRMSKDYRVIQVRREDQLPLQGCETLSVNPRQLALSILLSDKRLFIDSFMQHCAAALNKPSTVVWVGNSPTVFGYAVHQNIKSNFEVGALRNSMYDPFDIIGDPIQLATPPNNLFSVDEIINSLTLDPVVQPFASAIQELINENNEKV
jgi:hypothetical protein